MSAARFVLRSAHPSVWSSAQRLRGTGNACKLLVNSNGCTVHFFTCLVSDGPRESLQVLGQLPSIE